MTIFLNKVTFLGTEGNNFNCLIDFYVAGSCLFIHYQSLTLSPQPDPQPSEIEHVTVWVNLKIITLLESQMIICCVVPII